MTFISPFWLLLLLPWLGVLAWVLMGRADFARISTTQFWDKTDTASRTRRGLRKPPLAYVLLLLAMLCSILAAGGLALRHPAADEPVTLIIDRGLRTSAALRADAGIFDRLFPKFGLRGGYVDVVTAPDGAITRVDQDGTQRFLRNPHPTAQDTRQALIDLISREKQRTDRPIIVVTKHALPDDDARVTVVAPAGNPEDASIEHFAVIDSPSPQAMVRVRNQTAIAQATLRVGGVEQAIDLPGRGEARDYFVDLPSLGEFVVATLEIEDAIDADDHAYLARSGAWPRLEARVELPPALARFVEVYQRQRPAAAGAPLITFTADPNAERSVILMPTTERLEGAVRAEAAHPLTRELDWGDLLVDTRITRSPNVPPGKVLIRVADQPILVETASGSLWLAFDPTTFAQRPEFVIFLTRVLDHLAGAAPRYAAEPAQPVPDGWTRLAPASSPGIDAAPGVYRTPEGLIALTVRPDNRPAAPATGVLRVRAEVVPLHVPLLVGALLMALWGAFRLTR